MPDDSLIPGRVAEKVGLTGLEPGASSLSGRRRSLSRNVSKYMPIPYGEEEGPLISNRQPPPWPRGSEHETEHGKMSRK